MYCTDEKNISSCIHLFNLNVENPKTNLVFLLSKFGTYFFLHYDFVGLPEIVWCGVVRFLKFQFH